MTHRRPLFAANWKMYKTPDQARAFVRAFREPASALAQRAAIALLVPFTDLAAVRAELEGSPIAFGAQDCFWERQGAFTGEVSAAMLGAIGARYCIVGHSERRRLFGETDETVAKKVSALLDAGVTPIVCVGESLAEKQAGRTRERIESQVANGLGHLSAAQRAALVVAYEPVWAIGSGLADQPETADATIAFLRSCAAGLNEATVLYGGSMKADNAWPFCCREGIDGGLVGSASLDPAGFIELVRNGLENTNAG